MKRESATACRSRSGLTMAIALLLLALVAVALVSVAQLVRNDARRTLKETDEAQLRSLTLAGIATARETLRATHSLPAEMDVPLPAELTDYSLRLSNHLADDQWIVLTRVRTAAVERAGETAFARSDGAWTVVRAEPTTQSSRTPTSRP